jgi:hypothetical protein
MTNLIIREFNGKKIRHREDGFMSLTDMCQATGKRFSNWYQLDSTKEYLKALQSKHYCDRSNAPIEVSTGGDHSTGLTGTWGDRHVAIRLAQWLSPEFALQVDEWVLELMNKGSVSIKAEQPAIGPSLGIADLNSIYGMMQGLGLTEDPILKSGFSQRLAEHLATVPTLPGSSADRLCVLTVRASELGIPQKLIGSGSALGKMIRSLGIEPVGKSQHGKYEVNVYRVTPELDRAILSIFLGK